MTRLSARPPDPAALAREAKRRAGLNARDFDLGAAITAAEEAAAALKLLLRLHSVFKASHPPGWHRDQIARLRR